LIASGASIGKIGGLGGFGALFLAMMYLAVGLRVMEVSGGGFW